MILFTLFYSEEDYRVINLQNVLEYNQILDYNIIKNKLTKVDYLKKTPSDSVVSYYMFKKLGAMIKEEDSAQILYILKSINEDVINNVSAVVSNLCENYGKEYEIRVAVKSKSVNPALYEKYEILDLNADQ